MNITPDNIIARMTPGRSYKPAILAAMFGVGTSAMRETLVQMEKDMRLQSEVHVTLRHWRLPILKSEPVQVAPVERSSRTNMPDYSHVRERLAESRAIPSNFTRG
jgi:hypothetical protein